MTPILHHIRSLELYALRDGARLVRAAVPDCVMGRVCHDRIILRAGLTPQQELLTLVHELTHWLAHPRDARPGLDCTVFEYEAEAVEVLVMVRLGLAQGLDLADLDHENPTDDLLSSSVARVRWASSRICAALGVDTDSEPQAAIHLEAAAGKEIIFEYEQHGMSNLLGLPQAL